MPVIDHGVHEHGVRDAEHRYGCWNRRDYFDPLVLRPFCIATDGWVYATEERHPHRMSHECRYDRSLTDIHCLGCKHAGSGERYTAEQEDKGAE